MPGACRGKPSLIEHTPASHTARRQGLRVSLPHLLDCIGVWGGSFRIRSVQDRHRPVQLPHRGADAGGAAVRPGPGTRRPDGARGFSAGRAVRFAGRHRQGHGTDKGVLLGLMGEAPDTVDPAAIAGLLASVRSSRQLSLLGRHTVPFIEKEHMMFYRREALAETSQRHEVPRLRRRGRVAARVALPVRGRRFRGHGRRVNSQVIAAHDQLPFPFRTGRELLTMCKESGLTVAQLMMKNELTWRDEAEVNGGLDRIWQVMQDCVARGCGINYPGPMASCPARCGCVAAPRAVPQPDPARRARCRIRCR